MAAPRAVPPVTVDVHGWGWRHAGRRAWALRGVDLHIEPGERVLLLGPSGAGKSTLLAALAGLLDASNAAEHEGSMHLDGQPSRSARQLAGLVMQDPEAALVMARAGDDVAFGLENRAVPADEIWPRVDEALRAVGFPYGRDAGTGALSGGEQQRLALAGILALRPGLLLLDEVTANLDPSGAALVRHTIADVLASSGATVVMVEHRVASVVDLVDRAVVLEPGGGIAADGQPAEVFGARGAALAASGVWVPGHEPYVRRRATSAPGPVLVSAVEASFRYPATAREAMTPTSVSVSARQALAVTGANGSGKSTLALLLAGLLRPSTGSVTAEPALGGQAAENTRIGHAASTIANGELRRRNWPPDLPKSPFARSPSLLPTSEPRLWRWRGRDLVRAIGTVFQDPEHQFVAATVRDELALGPRRAGAEGPVVTARVEELLERLGLSALAGANPFTLSGGEKRRLSVATAIATAPAMVVTDEPTFGQDARTWAELVGLLADLRDDGCAVVTVTHDEALVEAIADRRLTMIAKDPARDGPGILRDHGEDRVGGP
jgi:energy-coupling factor transporter ATP-binding protein EcfA2